MFGNLQGAPMVGMAGRQVPQPGSAPQMPPVGMAPPQRLGIGPALAARVLSPGVPPPMMGPAGGTPQGYARAMRA